MEMTKALWVGVKAAWMGIAVLVLFVTLYAFDGKPNSDIGIFLAWSMLFLSFPMGLIYPALFTVVAMVMEKYFSTVIPTSYILLTLDWAALFALGYLQWFKLIPYFIGKLNKLSSRNRGQTTYKSGTNRGPYKSGTQIGDRPRIK